MSVQAPLAGGRDWSRIDAWLGFASVVVVLIANKLTTDDSMLVVRFFIRLTGLLQPFFLLRVVRHFWHVPDRVMHIALGAALVLASSALFPETSVLTGGGTGYLLTVGAQAVSVVLCLSIAKAYFGLMRYRMGFAAVGAACVGGIFLTLFRTVDQYPSQHLVRQQLWFAAGLIVSTYLGLLTPGFLRRWVQRGEEYRFLSNTIELDPQMRGQRAAGDLAEAVARSIAASSVAVAVGDDLLTIRSANRPGWLGQTAIARAGVGQAIRQRESHRGPIDELEPEWRGLDPHATRFLAVPIRGKDRVWGAVIVTQLRGSMFPQDDIDLIGRYCRHAGGIFDHAALLEAEREREQREADAKLGMIVDSLPDYAVITVDAGGAILTASAGIETVAGVTQAEIRGASVAELFHDGAPWLAQALSAAQRGEPFMCDVPVRQRGRDPITGSMVLRPVIERGQPTGRAVIVVRDVTRQRAIEQRLRQSEKMEAMGQMTAGIAHNFNNMVHVIQLHADELRQQWLELDAMAQVRGIAAAVDKAKDLAKQLLSFGKGQPGKLETFRLGPLVEGILPMVDTVLTSAVTLDRVIDADTPVIRVDRSRMEQVIVNLAVNARDAIEGSGVLTVRVYGKDLEPSRAERLGVPSGRYGVLEMSDTGSGMDAATRARLFEPFFTTKARGTGLGLATVQAAVIDVGGAIDVESAPGHGTTFRICIPEYVPPAA